MNGVVYLDNDLMMYCEDVGEITNSYNEFVDLKVLTINGVKRKNRRVKINKSQVKAVTYDETEFKKEREENKKKEHMESIQNEVERLEDPEVYKHYMKYKPDYIQYVRDEAKALGISIRW